MIKLNGEEITFKHFNDGTTRANISVSSGAEMNVVWLFDNNEEHLLLYYLISHLKEHKCKIILEIPYFPNARQDRQKNDSDVFTLKHFCNLLNSLAVDEIRVFDVHSPVSLALLNNAKLITPHQILNNLIIHKMPRDVLVAYPDSGSEHRYSAMLRLPYIVGVKERDWETMEIRSLEILGSKDMIANHDFLMVDDIISRGSTIYLAAKRLKELGANNIYVYCSHLENTVLNPKLTGVHLLDEPNLITKIYTTNSIWHSEHPKVEVIKEW